MTKAKKIGIGIGITVGGIILFIFAFMLTENFEEGSVIEENTQRTFEEDLALIVFDLNFCPNQGKIIGSSNGKEIPSYIHFSELMVGRKNQVYPGLKF